jgi:hypothetical protein
VHHWVIWPRGAEHNGDQVLLADGTAVTEGATLTGSGLLLPIADAVPKFTNRDSVPTGFGRRSGGPRPSQ